MNHAFNFRMFMLAAAILLLFRPVLTHDRFRQVHDLQKIALSEASHNETATSCNSTSCYRYYNEDTAPYLIEQWPDVKWDTGEFYSGSIPVDESDPNRTLFFVFKPAEEKHVDEVVIWLNGGPGCSSLFGFFAENGPISWARGTSSHHKKNRWAWSKITNMLWVEQPVHTGFSQGKLTVHNENGVAKDFVAFFKNWETLFGIQSYKIYITGESYAGRYVPYISKGMLDQNDKTYFDLSGALMYSPCIGDCGTIQGVIPTWPFVQANNVILGMNETFMSQLKQVDEDCGYAQYRDRYLSFPPPEHQPAKPFGYGPLGPHPKCDIAWQHGIAQFKINPCFNYYHIVDTCPQLSNMWGRDYELYFNRKDVKEAIHAPLDVKWYECTPRQVFTYYKIAKYAIGEDPSPLSIEAALPQVIEATNRVLISNGNWDFLLPTNGTLMCIQNMTWNGKLGFQEAPAKDLVIQVPRTGPFGDGPQGVMGKQHYERGLQWVETYQAGHEQPMYQPKVAWRQLQWLLGRIDEL